MEAMQGDEADELGYRIFDLSKNGCDFRIKVEKQGDFPTYVSSRFAPPAEVDGVDDDNIQEVYDSIHDLESVFPVKSYDQLKEVLDEHYHCKSSEDAFESTAGEVSTAAAATATVKEAVNVADDDDDDDPLEDDKVKELLDGLGD